MTNNAVPDTTGANRAAAAHIAGTRQSGDRQSMARAVRRRLPKPVKRAIAPCYGAGRSALHVSRSKVELMALKQEYRARFGPGFVYTIDDRDEMFQRFHSTESAGDLDHEQQHEVIFVASLFSHLTIERWNAWLCRVYELVAPGGLLIFSTHGPYVRDFVYDDAARARLETLADGFSYLLTNETHGRLAEDYYGSAFVTEAYVRAKIAEHGLGTVKHVYPAKLWGTQDLYVLEKPACRG